MHFGDLIMDISQKLNISSSPPPASLKFAPRPALWLKSGTVQPLRDARREDEVLLFRLQGVYKKSPSKGNSANLPGTTPTTEGCTLASFVVGHVRIHLLA
ncbi:unnamed protein product [Ixodes pacificus]